MRWGSTAAALAMLALATAPSGAIAKGFESPSGNIGCVITTAYARCDIAKRDFTPPPKPRKCKVDWGQGLYIAKKGRGRWVCAGDTTLGQGNPLAYGKSIKLGRFKCKSSPSGMRCLNTRNRHGFLISRERARRF